MSRVITNFQAPFSPATSGARQQGKPNKPRTDFFNGVIASLRRASLGLFFGVAPKMTQGRTDEIKRSRSDKKAANDADTRLAKNIYQSMLDITGH